MVVPEGEITPTWMQYSWAVTPSLLAWTALLMPGTTPAVIISIGGLAAAGYLDLIQYGYPGWFKGLRFILTTVAILSLWSTLMCKMLLQDEEEKKKKNR